MRFSVLEPREPREPFSKPVALRDTRTITPLCFPGPRINGAVSERVNRLGKTPRKSIIDRRLRIIDLARSLS